MAARKARPVLYEVVRRSRREREAGWRQRILSPLGNQSDTVDEETTGTPEEAPPVMVPAGPPKTAPLVIRDGKLHMSLGWISGLAIGLALLLLLWVAYDAGRRSVAPTETPATLADSGQSTPSDAFQDGDSRPAPGRVGAENTAIALPQRAVPNPVGVQPQPEPKDQESALLPSGRYILIQDFSVQRNRGLRERDARAAIAHLRAKNIEAVIVRQSGQAPLVVASQRLDELSRQQVEALKARIREAGEDFSDYSFKDCYERSF